MAKSFSSNNLGARGNILLSRIGCLYLKVLAVAKHCATGWYTRNEMLSNCFEESIPILGPGGSFFMTGKTCFCKGDQCNRIQPDRWLSIFGTSVPSLLSRQSTAPADVGKSDF